MTFNGPNRDLPSLEAEGLAFAASNPAIAQVPFAKANKAWLEIVQNYRPGDTIRAYTTRGIEDRIHTTGYALSRNGCVVTYMYLSIGD